MQRLVVCCTIAGLLGLGTSRAHAQTKIAVLGVEALDAPADLASRFTEALRIQVRQSVGLRLLPGKSLEEIKLVFGCVDEKGDCMARAGRSLGAAKLIWGTLKKSGAGYNLTIKYLDVPAANVEKFVSENVGELGPGGAQEVIERMTGSFLPGSRGSLRVNSNVEGAAVELAGKPVGSTGPAGLVLHDIRPGNVDLRVTKAGYRPWSQTVTVSSGETAYVNAELEAAPEVPLTQPATQPVSTTSTRTGWKAAFWTSTALTVGFGVTLIASGVSVLQRQDEKKNAINTMPGDDVTKAPFTDPNRDACAAAATSTLAGTDKIRSACDSGQTWQTVSNVFLGLTIAAGLTSIYFGYKAYMQKDEAEKEPEQKTARGRAIDWLVAPSAGPTGGGLNLLMRY